MDTITGCWEGALISGDGKREAQFAFRQPSHSTNSAGPVFSLNGAATHTQLLDGAEKSFVALADAPDGSRDERSGHIAQLLLEARVLGDRLVGSWLRRDSEGHVVASGALMGART